MLLDDGTCPRCNPPSRRSTADKLQLAKHYKDPKLQALAHAEIEAGIATGFDEQGLEPPAPRRVVSGRTIRRGPPPQRPAAPVDDDDDDKGGENKDAG